MGQHLPQLESSNFSFPPPTSAWSDPDGLLAFGGDLHPDRIMNAYGNGIFPWFSPGEPILWWCPSVRSVISKESLHLSKSLIKVLRKTPFRVSINRATSQVIHQCAATRPIEETWITKDMVNAYSQLASLGHCHSVEVWDEQQLVGGLYGIAIGRTFCGESMFSLASNASKIALAVFQHHFFNSTGLMIDCQLTNPHLTRLGALEVSRGDFLSSLKEGANEKLERQFYSSRWLDNPWGIG